jgi:hypothetical protein
MLHLRSLPEPSLADKPPGCASVKSTLQGQSAKVDWPWDATPLALENLNRLEYIDRVTATGVKADRP